MGHGTHCEYSLFGATYRQQALSDTWLHFLEKLYERDPDGLRDCVPFSDWLETRNCFGHLRERRPSPRAYEVAEGLWARVDRCKRDNVEEECWKLLERLGCRRSDFVIYGFPEASTLIDGQWYVVLVRHFKKLQELHEETRKALSEAESVLRQAPAPVAAEAPAQHQHRPIDSFLDLREDLKRIVEGRGDSTSPVAASHRENSQ